ncbi:hypothetical protein GN958_ATG12144 [Phytophthora infestans]|uniref:DUSP domain-containing protein n=1 Tax=Phytophthora infestans TaxID=4787 RepID=A0A8S9UH93_PHYIN|nr:hypothetical protein GN958_ATG12144 [Phytophthora infestans]
MPEKTASKSKKSGLNRARELLKATQLEQGDHWFAVATAWWEEFDACRNAKDAPSVQNESLVDKQLSVPARTAPILKPELAEGTHFVFLPEPSWDRSRQQLQIESYPFVFKIFSWTADETEPVEVVDDAGQEVVVLGSRNHTLGQLLSEVWLASPVEFHRQFPNLLGSVDFIAPCLKNSTTASSTRQVRVCYHSLRTSSGAMEWIPIEKMRKRLRSPRTSRLQARTKKRQEREGEESRDEQSGGSESEVEVEEQLQGSRSEMNVKFGDLRLDNRSEVASGSARLHELLIEQKRTGHGDMGWPSQGPELHWRMALDKGDILDALDTSRAWFEARVLAARRNKINVHYRSWETKWDEWIPRTSPRLAPSYSRVPRWRSALRPHSLVQVGIEVPRLKHTKWRNATVIEVVPSTDVDTQRESDGVGLRVHIQVDDDDMWLPAHDDLLCRSNTHNESSPLTKRERQMLSYDNSLDINSAEERHVDSGGEQVAYECDGDDEERAGVTLIDHEGSRSPPPTATKVAVTTTASRAARSLNTSFSEVEDRGRSSAGRTPGGRGSRGQSQVSSNETSPEIASPDSPSIARPSTPGLQTLWAQVGRDLQSLQTSWTQLGEGLFAAVDEREHEEN